MPEKMLGSFQMETSEGFDEFMYEMGVNMFTRYDENESLIRETSVLVLMHILLRKSYHYFWPLRKIANNLYPLQEIRMEEDGQMCIDTFTRCFLTIFLLVVISINTIILLVIINTIISSFKNTKTKFPLGTAWEEYTADGRTTQTVTTVEGNIIVKVDNSNSTFVWEKWPSSDCGQRATTTQFLFQIF